MKASAPTRDSGSLLSVRWLLRRVGGPVGQRLGLGVDPGDEGVDQRPHRLRLQHLAHQPDELLVRRRPPLNHRGLGLPGDRRPGRLDRVERPGGERLRRDRDGLPGLLDAPAARKVYGGPSRRAGLEPESRPAGGTYRIPRTRLNCILSWEQTVCKCTQEKPGVASWKNRGGHESGIHNPLFPEGVAGSKNAVVSGPARGGHDFGIRNPRRRKGLRKR
jgi:hypothetical protein